MTSSRILREVTQTTALSLSQRDVRIIKDVMEISAKLKADYAFDTKMDLTSADIIFANIENDITLKLFIEHGEKLQAVPIYVYTEDATKEAVLEKYPNAITLSSPIKISNLKTALTDVVSTPSLKFESRIELSLKVGCFKMLVVDDSFPVRKYLEQKLPDLMNEIDPSIDFDIQYASSGKEAVNKIKAARGAFDIVFLDVMMDDIDGYKICKWIKKVKKSIEVVMLTSKSSPLDRVRANMSGSDNFLSKPPRDAHLKKVILKHKKFKNALI